MRGYPAFIMSVMSWLKTLLNKPQGLGLGERGENIAARFLRDKGYRILVRNYRTAMGEIDIIARDGDVIVFVEVKTREEDEPRPEDQVNLAKQHQLTKAAKMYMSRYGNPRPPARFDVVAVVWPAGREAAVRHTTSAFEGTF